MHLSLAERLLCPRCGPPHPLILLAHDVRERRVRRGEFGCSNCRDRFPVEAGFGDLRPPPRAPEPTAAAPARSVAGHNRALRLAAALGVAGGPGLVLLDDPHAEYARPLARIVGETEVVVAGWGGRAVAGPGVSAFVSGPAIPMRDNAARGVAVGGEDGERAWRESLRVLARGGRLVISQAPDAARAWLRSAGLVQVLDDDGLLVAVEPPGGAAPRAAKWRGGPGR